MLKQSALMSIHCIICVMNGTRLVSALMARKHALSVSFSLQMNLTLILIRGEIIYMDYLKSTESMKTGLCPSNKGRRSSEVMAGRLMFSQGQSSFGVGLFNRLVL